MGRRKVMKGKMVFELALQWVMKKNEGNSRKCTQLVITVKMVLEWRHAAPNGNPQYLICIMLVMGILEVRSNLFKREPLNHTPGRELVQHDKSFDTFSLFSSLFGGRTLMSYNMITRTCFFCNHLIFSICLLVLANKQYPTNKKLKSKQRLLNRSRETVHLLPMETHK